MNEPEEPHFVAIRNDDPEMQRAYARAAETVAVFREYVERPGEHICSAKLRFRDPDLSGQMGEDRFLFLWFTSVLYHSGDRLFSGVFFEVPAEFQKWHHVGERLGFEAASTGWSTRTAVFTAGSHCASSVPICRRVSVRGTIITLECRFGSRCLNDEQDEQKDVASPGGPQNETLQQTGRS